MKHPTLATLLTALALATGLIAGPVSIAGRNGPAPATTVTNSPPLRSTGPGSYAIGEIRFTTTNRTVRLPATVNMVEGLVEYWLVASNGKTHESLFKTTAEPLHLHLAMLFLGAKGATNASPDKMDATLPVPGDDIRIWAEWTDGKKTIRRRAEELVTQRKEKKPMSAGPWTYNGSWTFEGRFVAQTERSFISIIRDPAALANNPRPGRDDDELWEANTALMPVMGTPVEIVIELPVQNNQKSSP
ncbi:MAG TPA: YdjY domain-containing protein [Roseimicrobium sp.]|nr:YdjY domain-containing protein [Roseimicrobium sp.]